MNTATTTPKTESKLEQAVESNIMAKEQSLVPDFGRTRYSRFGEEVYKDAISILHLSPKQSEKLARSAMADVGFALQNSAASIKVGAMKKSDSTFTIAEVATMKNIIATNAICLVKLMRNLQDCVKFGLMFKQSTFDLAPNMIEWLNK